MTTEDLDDAATADDEHSVTRTMIIVFVALCALTCASLLTYTDFWQQRVPMEIGRGVMLAVSVCKALLVATFFMHLWWEKSWKWVVTIPATCVSTLLCVALVPDIGRRTLQYENLRWLRAAEPMPYHVGDELVVAQPAAGTHFSGKHASGNHSDDTSEEEPH